MHHNYQQLDLQTLIDLLADETEKFTKDFVNGSSKKNGDNGANISALVEEINLRKSANELDYANKVNFRMKKDFPCC